MLDKINKLVRTVIVRNLRTDKEDLRCQLRFAYSDEGKTDGCYKDSLKLEKIKKSNLTKLILTLVAITKKLI